MLLKAIQETCKNVHKTFTNKKYVEQSKENKQERRYFPDTCQLIEPKSDLFWSTTDLQWALRILNIRPKIIIALPKSLGSAKTFCSWFKNQNSVWTWTMDRTKNFCFGPNLSFAVSDLGRTCFWSPHVFSLVSSPLRRSLQKLWNVN